MDNLLTIFTGSVILTLIHAAIPNHWLPLVVIGKTEQWSEFKLLLITAISGFAHTLSTVLIGIVIGFIGYELSHRYEFLITILAPLILIAIGLYYIFLHIRSGKTHSHENHEDHHHHHHHHHNLEETLSSVADQKTITILISLSAAMFFSSCVEIEAYFLTASMAGWTGIGIVAAVYVLLTVLCMLVFVWLSYKGIKNINSEFLEKNEQLIIGIVLILLAIATFFGVFEFHF